MLLVCPVFFAGGQVRFSASISPAVVGKDEYAQLKLMVENAKDLQQIDPPELKNFIIVGGPNQESGMSMVNGDVKKYFALNYILKPIATGNFSIPPALAKADGVYYKSNPVSIKVVLNPTGNSAGGNLNSPFAGLDPFADAAPRAISRDFILKKGEDPLEKIQKNMFVKLEVDKTSCYVGEPIIATYKLFTRLKSESNLIKNPSFNGFSVIDMQQPDDMSYHTEKMNGREYNVYSIRKVQLYPLLPGNLELGAAEIDNNVHFIKAEYASQKQDVFNDMFSDMPNTTIPPDGVVNQKIILQNKPVSILVKSLPDLNKPAAFKGAVGNFAIEAKLEKDNFSTDDAGRIAVIISGVGNLQMINAPEIKWPGGIEGFDSKANDDLYKGTVPVSGRKIFEFLFTVANPGTYTIPEIEFNFFDIKSMTYKTIRSKALQVIVTKGAGKPKRVSLTSNDKPLDSYLVRFFNNRLRVVSLVAILIICGLILWLKKDKKKEAFDKTIEVIDEAISVPEKTVELVIKDQENPFIKAEEHLKREEIKLFYLALNEGLKNYLSGKFSILPEKLNKKNITEAADKQGISNETAVQLYGLMDAIEFQVYTPFADKEKMKELYERANDVVQLLNTYRNQA